MSEEYILQMKNISKRFPGVKALDNVNFNLKRQSVHTIVGENGAGKSTLMKILSGMYTPDEGEILINGKNVTISNPKESIQNGISMIYQELNPIPEMTIAENLFMGREYTNGPVLDKRRMLKESKKMLEDCGVYLNPNTKMCRLSVAEKQLIEIVKAIFYNSQIIVMDEPTSAITEKEVDNLFKIIEKLLKDGKSVIYITHKMDEIFKICDDATVLRDGQFIGSKPIKELDKEKIISMMVGRELSNHLFAKLDAEIGEVALEVKNLTVKCKFENISFNVKKGEILGVAGLMGAGRSEVMETIFGLRKADSGEIFIHGKKVNIKSPKDAIKNKVAFITEDRKLLGLNLVASVKDNIALVNLAKYCIFGKVVDYKKIRTVADAQIDALRIKTPSREQIVNNLSGGNQQKVVLAKWLLCEPDILILDEPTRGIDVGAKAEIYRLISAMAQQGKTIIMISSELPEIIGMSDRVIVLHEGQLTGILNRDELDQEKIMTYAAGSNS